MICCSAPPWRRSVLFLTLRSIGATLVVALSILISIIGTFLGMALTGRNLNVISMAGLSFAIGMGVDNTIVVLENIFRHREMGKDRVRAAIDGAQEVWGAILAATLANIAVFLPVVFIQEEAGQLFQDISVAISISLLLYLLVSPTVIPVLATLFLRQMPSGFGEQTTQRPPGANTRLAAHTAAGAARRRRRHGVLPHDAVVDGRLCAAPGAGGRHDRPGAAGELGLDAAADIPASRGIRTWSSLSSCRRRDIA